MTRLTEFLRRESGAALVEFAIVLPFMMLMFAVVIEGSRLMWAYQATIAGVRDATRYAGRVIQTDICTTGSDVSGWSGVLTDIVRNTSAGQTLFPNSITINQVDATLTCVTGNYRMQTTPVVTVTAQLSITYPFKGLFALSGLTLEDVNTAVSDSARVFGA